MYGLTEMTTRVSYVPPEQFDAKLGSAGRPLQGIEVRTDADAPGGEGELQVRGPNAMLGYWRKPEATEAVVTEDGWIRTGDAARIDDDGFIWLGGRLKDTIKRGDAIVYPLLLEEVVRSEWDVDVREVAAVGVTRMTDEDVLGLFVVPDDPDEVGDERRRELRAAISRRLGSRYRPDLVRWRDTLPETHAGKIKRADLREALRDAIESDDSS